MQPVKRCREVTVKCPLLRRFYTFFGPILGGSLLGYKVVVAGFSLARGERVGVRSLWVKCGRVV